MNPGQPIVLDLAKVTFLEGSILHWLGDICVVTGHPVVLRNTPPSVRRILDFAATVAPDDDAWVYRE